ncbi:uncharacterized protein LOC132277396 [Cornus florida]|uniref:uncharacterized protein LOC132277396 n=1 Tax=Cornus florida TaxID=4283 RepID=UPI00289C4A8D|nr:uncharacterized protein LOC132277396 [Cornus florida]
MVNATTSYERLTFLDAYFGYNQILMNLEDEEKTCFIIKKDTYCYRVMPFGFKNAGATYQRLVNKIFDEMLGKTVEAYIDDMVVKSVKKEDHPKHLQEVFDTLRKYNMKLNPSKRSFIVSTGKLLGHIVNKRGIEGPQQQVALNQLKCYTAEPLFLSTPKPGETLIMYLAISSIATSAVLIREEGKNQHPVFYASKTMTDAKTLYSKIEKIILALVDGSSNLTSAGAGVVIITSKGTKLQQSICLTFLATNNEAEYKALLAGLRLANQLQVTDKYQPKEKRMKAYKEVVENQLAAAASSSDEDLVWIISIDILDEPNINPRQEVMVIPDIPRELCWMDQLEAYLKHGTLPNQKAKARKLRLTTVKYSIINNQLFRKSFLGPYLKCLSPTETLVILKQIHDRDYGNHSGGRSLAHKPAKDLHAIANPWPFAQWGIDMVRPLPKTVEQKEYVLLAMDYFTKWVEEEAYSCVTHEQVKSFLWNNIIYRFRVPKVIMMDNGPNLDNKSTRKFFAEHEIRQNLAIVSHPQGMGRLK